MAINSFGGGMPYMQPAFNGATNLLTAGLGVATSATQLLTTLLGNQQNAATQWQGQWPAVPNNPSFGGTGFQPQPTGMNGFAGLMQAVAGVLQAMAPLLQMLGGGMGGMGGNPMASQFANQLPGLMPGYGAQFGGAGMGLMGMSGNALGSNSALNWVMSNSGQNLTQGDVRNNMNLYSIFHSGQRLY